MNFLEVFNKPLFILPKKIPSDSNYYTFIKGIFEEYLDLINVIEEPFIKIKEFSEMVNVSNLLSNQKRFTNGLINTLDNYFDGKPSKAFKSFSETIETRKTKFDHILKNEENDKGTTFYRVRIKNENYPYKIEDMFHIPFEYRGKVPTQRYSIPGFPSLYMGESIYVCWEELRRPDIDSFYVSRLMTKTKTSYIDLSPAIIDNEINKDIYRYFITWPLIAACSICVKHPLDNFKPEYIIPQLLLQWVRDSREIDGIRYMSTHINNRIINNKDKIFNMVFPVKTNQLNGLCPNLASQFEITDPVSWQILQATHSGQVFLYNKEELNIYDEKIPNFSIIANREYPYSYSVFGKLEYFLNTLNTSSI